MPVFHGVRQEDTATPTPGLHTCRVNTPADVRALWLHRLITSPMEKLVNLLYGRLFPVHDLLSQAAAGQQLPEGPAIGQLSNSALLKAKKLWTVAMCDLICLT